MKKIIDFIKNKRNLILFFVLLIALSVIVVKCYNAIDELVNNKQKIEFDDSAKIHHVVYNEGNFSNLKKENKQLYDSLKKYKKQIDFLTSFDYQKEYNIDKVTINKKKPNETLYIKSNEGYKEYASEPFTYEYFNNSNDSIEYKLKINSYTEPNWYSLNVKVKDKITIVDKDNGKGSHTLDIGSQNKATISNAAVYKKKRSFWNRFAVGPSVTAGYDPFNKKLGMTVGVGVTFDLTK